MSDSENQRKPAIVGQLFSDIKHILSLQWDRSKLSRIKKPTQIPKGFRGLVLLKAYADTFGDQAVGNLVNSYLDLTVSIDGIGREEALQAESLIQGIAIKHDKTPPPQPNLLDKIVNSDTNKEYQEFQQWKELRELDQNG